jgi:hypothetical protein
MGTIVGFLILTALSFYAFEVFWTRTVERTKNDDIHNDTGTHTRGIYTGTGMG